MERYQIKVKILDRVFPMMVTREEEESINLAVKLIEEKISVYQNKFNIKDDIYLVLMCCLDLSNEVVKLERDHHQFKSYFAGKINLMNEMLDTSLDRLQQPS